LLDDKLCRSCMFWEVERSAFGKCRRLPPVASNELENDDEPFAGQIYNAFWPTTFEEDWCGEWKSAEG